MKKIGLLLFAVIAIVFTACEKDDDDDNKNFVDGTYYAEISDFSHGWKAFLEAEISDDDIVAVDFDMLDDEGNRKSQTTVENYPMDPHPTVWVPEYEARVLAADISNFTEIDVYTGATGSWGELNALMEAILAAAEEGDTSDQIVTIEE